MWGILHSISLAETSTAARCPSCLPKGKVFFLYSEALVRYNPLQTNAVTVPNPAFRTGDFSALLAGSSKHYIKDLY